MTTSQYFLQADETVVEAYSHLSRASLDVIGSAGFGYEFNSITETDPSKLSAFLTIFSNFHDPHPTATKALIRDTLKGLLGKFPSLWNWIPSEKLQNLRKVFGKVEEECRHILKTKRQDWDEEVLDRGEKKRKDLIGLMIQSSEAENGTRMTDEEILGQISTLILTGGETVATSVMYVLYHLSQHPSIQQRLREEIREAKELAGAKGLEEGLDMNELNSMPFLDAVVREVLRLDPPAPLDYRVSTRATTLPLSAPLHGDPHQPSHISLQAGQLITLCPSAVNRSQSLFGEDANEFRPERWLEPDNPAVGGERQRLGVWAGLMTFLCGPRVCIGWKFALVEMKMMLSVLLDEFEFELREPEMKIVKRAPVVISRPVVIGEEELGYRMPLRIRRAEGKSQA